MTDEKKIIKGLDKELMQLIDAEMNDPVIGKLLNRNGAYVLGKEIKILFIDRACKFLEETFKDGEVINPLLLVQLKDKFRKAMEGE